VIEYNIHSGWTPGDQMGSVPSLLWEHTRNHVLVGIAITSFAWQIHSIFLPLGEKPSSGMVALVYHTISPTHTSCSHYVTLEQ